MKCNDGLFSQKSGEFVSVEILDREQRERAQQQKLFDAFTLSDATLRRHVEHFSPSSQLSYLGGDCLAPLNIHKLKLAFERAAYEQHSYNHQPEKRVLPHYDGSLNDVELIMHFMDAQVGFSQQQREYSLRKEQLMTEIFAKTMAEIRPYYRLSCLFQQVPTNPLTGLARFYFDRFSGKISSSLRKDAFEHDGQVQAEAEFDFYDPFDYTYISEEHIPKIEQWLSLYKKVAITFELTLQSELSLAQVKSIVKALQGEEFEFQHETIENFELWYKAEDEEELFSHRRKRILNFQEGFELYDSLEILLSLFKKGEHVEAGMMHIASLSQRDQQQVIYMLLLYVDLQLGSIIEQSFPQMYRHISFIQDQEYLTPVLQNDNEMDPFLFSARYRRQEQLDQAMKTACASVWGLLLVLSHDKNPIFDYLLEDLFLFRSEYEISSELQGVTYASAIAKLLVEEKFSARWCCYYCGSQRHQYPRTTMQQSLGLLLQEPCLLRESEVNASLARETQAHSFSEELFTPEEEQLLMKQQQKQTGRGKAREKFEREESIFPLEPEIIPKSVMLRKKLREKKSDTISEFLGSLQGQSQEHYHDWWAGYTHQLSSRRTASSVKEQAKRVGLDSLSGVVENDVALVLLKAMVSFYYQVLDLHSLIFSKKLCFILPENPKEVHIRGILSQLIDIIGDIELNYKGQAMPRLSKISLQQKGQNTELTLTFMTHSLQAEHKQKWDTTFCLDRDQYVEGYFREDFRSMSFTDECSSRVFAEIGEREESLKKLLQMKKEKNFLTCSQQQFVELLTDAGLYFIYVYLLRKLLFVETCCVEKQGSVEMPLLHNRYSGCIDIFLARAIYGGFCRLSDMLCCPQHERRYDEKKAFYKKFMQHKERNQSLDDIQALLYTSLSSVERVQASSHKIKGSQPSFRVFLYTLDCLENCEALCDICSECGSNNIVFSSKVLKEDVWQQCPLCHEELFVV